MPPITRSFSDLNLEIVNCTYCPRLVQYRESVARAKKPQFSSWSYWGRPVPGFGDATALILVVGLAPAPHGGNRTGRIFTGDKSAEFLVKALFKAGYSNQARSTDLSDGLELKGLYMTAAVKCVPPDNKPTAAEVLNCSRFLMSELMILAGIRVILCLGQTAYQSTMAILKKNSLILSKIPRFEHGLEVDLVDGRKLIVSYHPSPRNTQTGTLTSQMFDSVIHRAKRLADITQG